jgi:hypothetical protein
MSLSPFAPGALSTRRSSESFATMRRDLEDFSASSPRASARTRSPDWA